MNTCETYKSRLAGFLNAHHIDLYWKGRTGLYALLKAMDIGAGDEVIIQAFTCVVVPNAVMYCGATPKYVDVSKATLNTTLEKIKAKVTPQTKCIIIQNTFGLSSEVEEIVSYAASKNIYTIEDCTHGFGGFYNGRPNGTYSDAAFFSTQWNKPFSTGIGGFVLVNNTALLEPLRKVNSQMLEPGFMQSVSLGLLLTAEKLFLNDHTYWFLMRLYRKLSRWGLVLGSSSAAETDSPKQPEKSFMLSSRIQCKAGLKKLKYFKNQCALRKKNGLIYNSFMKQHRSFFYSDSLLENHSFLKYPVFVKNKTDFLKKAENAKIRLGDWFVSPLHPATGDLNQWHLQKDECPTAVFLAEHILNLPTDTHHSEKVIRFLKKHCSELLVDL